MKSYPRLIGLCLLVTASSFALSELHAQVRSDRLSATITFGDGTSLNVSKSETGDSELVALNPDEVVNLQLAFVTPNAGHRLVVQSLDGGVAQAVDRNSAPAADGTLKLSFRAGASPGLNRLLIINGATSSTLRFWVINTQQPDANPPLLH